MRSQNSKPSRRSSSLKVLQLPDERLDGPSGLPANCCLLRARPSARDGPARVCSYLGVLSLRHSSSASTWSTWQVRPASGRLVWRSSWQPVPPSPTSPADTVLPRARRRNGWNVDRDDRELRPAPLCTCGAVGRGGVICRVWQHVVRRPRCVGMDVYTFAVGETFVRRVGADQLRADCACLRGHPVV